MASVLLSLGSNVNRQQNIQACLSALATRFSAMQASPVYESVAVGFDGDNFYNLVVRVETTLAVGEVQQVLKEIEDAHGRIRGGARFSARTLDIDILTYDDAVGVVDAVELPRDEILKNAFVLLPLAELVPDAVHPVVGKSYKQLWDAFDQQSQKLWVVEL
jgi:2-amino-4-hydroxy-6-hydroxymethyldihydropteridine diphosphokinase